MHLLHFSILSTWLKLNLNKKLRKYALIMALNFALLSFMPPKASCTKPLMLRHLNKMWQLRGSVNLSSIQLASSCFKLTFLSPFGLLQFYMLFFLLNRLPTAALNNGNPYEKLFGKFLDHNFLKVFCSLAFCLDFLRNCIKLDLRARKCIFLGY